MAFLFNSFTGLDFTFTGYICHDLAGNKRHFKKVKMFNKSAMPLVIVFLITAALIFIFRGFLESYGFDWQVLSGGEFNRVPGYCCFNAFFMERNKYP